MDYKWYSLDCVYMLHCGGCSILMHSVRDCGSRGLILFRGWPCNRLVSHPGEGGVVALLVTSFYRNSIELQPDGASWPECWVIHIIELMKWSFLLIYACIIMNLCEFGTESFAKESEKHIKTDTTILTVAYTVAYTGFPYKNWILT